jgi:hypothetical protein
MDDLVGFVLVVLIGILAIFIIVRIVKAASRTVDKEQKEKGAIVRRWEPSWEPSSESQTLFVKEVKLGMTPAEVESALGLPETKADLGEKVLYKYQNMTVEFHSGKVADVR